MGQAQIQRGPKGFFTSEGEQIYYESYGEGEVVILCHGFGGNHAIWYQQIPYLGQSYRVVTWDQRGFGRSSNEKEQSGPLAAVIDLKRLFDHLEIDQAHLIGQSMGGWAVLGLALRYPERVISLTLADTPAGISTPGIERAMEEVDRRSRTQSPPDQRPVGLHPAIGEQLAHQDLAKAFLYEQIGSVADPSPENIDSQLLNTRYSQEDLRKLSVPVLFLMGSNDSLILAGNNDSSSPSEIIREAAEILPRSQIVEIPNTGHSPYFEEPKKWNKAVHQFLKTSSNL